MDAQLKGTHCKIIPELLRQAGLRPVQRLHLRLEIVEINGASAESIHIWDKDARFTHAVSALLWQYRTLFRIGAYHRSKGKKPPSLATFLKSWRLERSLTKNYPVTD